MVGPVWPDTFSPPSATINPPGYRHFTPSSHFTTVGSILSQNFGVFISPLLIIILGFVYSPMLILFICFSPCVAHHSRLLFDFALILNFALASGCRLVIGSYLFFYAPNAARLRVRLSIPPSPKLRLITLCIITLG